MAGSAASAGPSAPGVVVTSLWLKWHTFCFHVCENVVGSSDDEDWRYLHSMKTKKEIPHG